MKLESASTPVQIVGGSSTSNFSIAANGKAFRVLSDTLYSDKIGSIVREISCNAYDAHIMAGKKDVAFEIHAPDAFEPWFSVKDFGTGLTEEAINSVFTVFFQSTKDNSNDAIGCFGLGSKTPFSYTDQFTVTSIVDGTLSIYSAFISETGMPSIILMHKEDTTEGNGVEIKVSVKREDYRKFVEAIATQLQFFKTKPTILNAEIKFEERDYFYSGNGFRIADGSYYSKQYIIQGNVGYPLDAGKLRSAGVPSEVTAFIDSMQNKHVEFDFEIGQIGVTASREAVEYDSKTVANIIAKISQAAIDTKAYVEQQLKDKSAYEQAVFMNNNTLWRNISRATGIKPKGAQFGSYVSFDLSSTFNQAVSGQTFSKRIAEVMVRSKGRAGFSSHNRSHKTITPSDTLSYVFIVKDTSKKTTARLHKIFEEHKADNYVQIVPHDLENDSNKVHAMLVDAIEGATILRLSEIDIPKAEKTPRKKSQIGQFYTVTSPNSSTWTKEFDAIEDISNATLYVITNGKTIVSENGTYEYFALRSNTTNLPKLIAIPERNRTKAEKNPKLVSLDAHIKKIHAEVKTDQKLRITYKRDKLRQSLASLMLNTCRQDTQFKKVLQDTAPNSKLVRAFALYEKLKNIKYSHPEGNAVGVTPDTKYGMLDTNKILASYPLLKEYLDSHYYDVKHRQELAEYVAWIDSK